MSKIKTDHVFTSESVSEGHPDKVCDQISDSVLDFCLEADSDSRVACETLVTTDLVVVAGEITTKAKITNEVVTKIARDAVHRIGYNSPELLFSSETCQVLVYVHAQSPDISQGVSEGEGAFKEQGAGDQGMMFGYASDETAELMPAPVLYSHKIVERLAYLRKSQPDTYGFLRPDSKSQVSVNYSNGKPVSINTIVVSHQHTPEMKDVQLQDLVRQVSSEIIPANLMNNKVKYLVNPTGRFVIGGPHGDSGLTGRKIIVDTYGGVGAHGGGAFSGKDPSKVDRSAAYMCRYIAKNIVAAGLAKRCEVQVAYAIGYPYPVSVNVDTYGTGVEKGIDERLTAILDSNAVFDLRPAGLIKQLGLKKPFENGWSYKETAAYGHFGRSQFPWEKTDKTSALLAAAK